MGGVSAEVDATEDKSCPLCGMGMKGACRAGPAELLFDCDSCLPALTSAAFECASWELILGKRTRRDGGIKREWSDA